MNTPVVDPSRIPISGVPSVDIDLHTDENLLDSIGVAARLREAGPVVWLTKYSVYALPRFREVSQALKDWETFTSEEGVGLNEYINSIKDVSLHTHGRQHDEIRHVESRPLAPDKLAALGLRLREYAEGLVRDLGRRTRVDGVRDIAMKMPLDVITDLIGLDDAGRDNLYTWGVAGFNGFGPLHAPLTAPALEHFQSYFRYARESIPAKIKPGGWADQLFVKGRAVGWSEKQCRAAIGDYVVPSLDTTIHATSAGLKLFAQHPEQWSRICHDRSLLKSAVTEIVRLASPVRYFTRLITRDVEIGGVMLPARSRVLVMFASAKGDESEFPNPDLFDIERNPVSHVGWGAGKHACLGKALARMELTVLFDVLADHYQRFELGHYSHSVNNVIQGLDRLELTLIPAGDGRSPEGSNSTAVPSTPCSLNHSTMTAPKE